jgi:hypothetical protein
VSNQSRIKLKKQKNTTSFLPMSNLICFFKAIFVALMVFVMGFGFGIEMFAQEQSGEAKPARLLQDMILQIETNQAINDMYNYKFAKAEKQFRWLKQKYPYHPLPYFLLGLNQWWKISPDFENTKYDNKFMAYMDTTIMLAEKLFKEDESNAEATFFLSAAYGFQGRLHSERKNWRKATVAGKNALKYLDVSKIKDQENPELLFGDALYNYYSVWIPENYPLLKPVVMFFPEGNKDLGLKQLKEVARNAFYTRTEAQYFLMRILAYEENDLEGAFQLAEYLNLTYPDNAYFHRYHARMLYSTGRLKVAEKVSLDIIAKIDSGMIGYEAISGRYAAFYLGQIYEVFKDREKAKHYYKRAVAFGEEIEAYETGYYLHSLLNLAKIADDENDKVMANYYYKLIKKHAKRNHPVHEKARDYLAQKENKVKKKELKKLEKEKEQKQSKKLWQFFQ